MNADHARAGAGWSDDVIIAGEGLHDFAGDRLRIVAIARIIGGLAAAGLRPRHFDGAAGLLQQPDGGKADGRPEQVDKAGDEERDAHWALGHWRGSKPRKDLD